MSRKRDSAAVDLVALVASWLPPACPPVEFYAEVGRRVRRSREAAGLTQRQLGTMLGGNVTSHLSYFERGLGRGSLVWLFDIARALEMARVNGKKSS